MNAIKNKSTQNQTQPQIMENQRLILWCFLVTSILMFGGFTSAYIVRMAQGNWYKFPIPTVFLYSCIAILASSATMMFAYRSAKNDELERVKYGLWGTFLLGGLFLYLQLQGWKDLVSHDIYFSPKRSDNGDLTQMISGSFFYVISGIHLIHVIAGMVFLSVVIVKSYQWKVHKKNMLTISLASTFWHFVGLLWIYLYLFLKYWN